MNLVYFLAGMLLVYLQLEAPLSPRSFQNHWLEKRTCSTFLSGESSLANVFSLCRRFLLSTTARWWFQIFFIFTPREMIQFDKHIFQMG